MSAAGNPTARKFDRWNQVLVGLALLVLIASTIGAGAWWGFPVQDDTYMVRLLRMGGPGLILAEHRDRPVFGFFMASFARAAGERPLPYVAVGLLFWLILAAEAALLWVRLFPRWSNAWPAVVLAVVAPVVTLVQFTTLTTVLPCLLPVILVLAALLILLGCPDDRVGAGARLAAVLLGASAAVVSQYALATAAAGAAFLVLRRRPRSALTLGAGVAAGFVVFRAVSDVAARANSDPDIQIEALLRKPWSVPFRILAAAWDCLIGSWGRAASELRVDWSSKSTLLAAGVGLAVVFVVALTGYRRPEGPPEADGTLRALIVAVIAGLAPAFVIRGFPLTRSYETRFFLPVLVFASCATVAALLSVARPRFAFLCLLGVVFVCSDRLVLGAIEEKRLQGGLERIGEHLRPFVERAGMVVVVSAARIDMSPEERITKATCPWPSDQAVRLWMIRPDEAQALFGPRSGCRRPESLHLGPRIMRWPMAGEPIRMVLWDASASGEFDLEPYFRGCPSL